MDQVHATIAHQERTLERSEIERAVSALLPEPVDEHYVVIDGKRFPPKQVISLVTGIDRADFNTHQARNILRKLGFTVGRHSRETTPPRDPWPGPHGGREADALRPFMGRWVAQRGLRVLVAATTPGEVLAWLERHNQHADAVFLVPADDTQALGAAPA